MYRPRLYREGGTKATADYTVLVSQGRAVGGSTAPSFCLCVRPPRPLLAYWARQLGLPVSSTRRCTRSSARSRSGSGRSASRPRQVNGNSGKAPAGEREARLSRLPAAPQSDRMPRCGYCALGCTYDRKGDMLTTYVPRGLARRRADRPGLPGHAGGDAEGPGGRRRGRVPALAERPSVHPQGEGEGRGPAAGAINSPRIWRQSQVPDPADAVGRNLRLQPQVVVTALHAEAIEAWKGIPRRVRRRRVPSPSPRARRAPATCWSRPSRIRSPRRACCPATAPSTASSWRSIRGSARSPYCCTITPGADSSSRRAARRASATVSGPATRSSSSMPSRRRARSASPPGPRRSSCPTTTS